MTKAFSGLSPASLWHHFSQLTQIARPSKQEELAISHLAKWAKDRDLRASSDDVGNLCVYVPAKPGCEHAPLVVLQNHVDIVASNAADRPADADAALGKIPVIRATCDADGHCQPDDDGDWLVAPYTTLGADNGIGIAAAMAVAEDTDARHGPLALLFTLDEEQGMTGAKELDPDLLRDARYLINLDNEDDDAFTVGCAGGLDVELCFSGQREALEGGQICLTVGIAGLRGGHSGIDINRGRANAIRLLARLLNAIRDQVDLRLTNVEGGDLRNAIPRSAAASLIVATEHEAQVREIVNRTQADFADQFRDRDNPIELTVDVTPATSWSDAFTQADSMRLIDLLHAIPTGVAAMCAEIPDLVETSDNLAVVETRDSQVQVICCCRSSSSAALAELADRIAAIARLAGCETSQANGYPPWQPVFSSPLVGICQRTYRAMFPESEPRIEAIHAGLECGSILAHCPGMDAISIGPTLRGNHAPGERISISSTQKFYRFLCGVLEELSQ